MQVKHTAAVLATAMRMPLETLRAHLLHQVWLGLCHLVPALGVHAAALQARVATQPRAAVPTLELLLTPHIARQPVTWRTTWQAASPLVTAGPATGFSAWGAR
jgi:hypothetical protein